MFCWEFKKIQKLKIGKGTFLHLQSWIWQVTIKFASTFGADPFMLQDIGWDFPLEPNYLLTEKQHSTNEDSNYEVSGRSDYSRLKKF